MTQLMFYQRPVPLDGVRHRALRLQAGDHAFSRDSNSVPLAAVEFFEAAKELPMVFARGADGAAFPVAVLGYRDRQNLFVDAQGRWTGRYVPAFVRRYPFVLGGAGEGDLTVFIDEASARFSTQEGEALFTTEGEQTPLLKSIVEFLAQFQTEHLKTLEFARWVDAQALLQPLTARIDLADGERFLLNDLLVVDEAKLMALPAAEVEAAFRRGWLGLVYAHLMSLSNFARLIDL